MASGLLDYYVEAAIGRALATFAADASAFAALFGELGTSNPGAVTSWHATLFPGGSDDGIAIRHAYNGEDAKLPQVIVQVEEESPRAQPIGGRRVHVHESVTVTVLANGQDVTRALWLVLRQGLQDLRPWIQSLAGYGIVYLGGGAPHPADALASPQLAVMERNLRWRARSVMASTPTDYTNPTQVHVHTDAVTVADIGGGVAVEPPTS